MQAGVTLIRRVNDSFRYLGHIPSHLSLKSIHRQKKSSQVARSRGLCRSFSCANTEMSQADKPPFLRARPAFISARAGKLWAPGSGVVTSVHLPLRLQFKGRSTEKQTHKMQICKKLSLLNQATFSSHKTVSQLMEIFIWVTCRLCLRPISSISMFYFLPLNQ